MFLRRASIDKSTDNPAGHRTYRGTRRGRCEPTHRDHRSKARNGEQAKTGEKTGATAERTADPRALGGVGDFINVGMLRADVFVGYQADVGRRDARRLKRAYAVAGLCIGIVNSAYCFHVRS